MSKMYIAQRLPLNDTSIKEIGLKMKSLESF